MKKLTESPVLKKSLRYSTLLVIWSVLTAIIINYFNPAASLLIMAIYLLVVIVSLTNISSLVIWVVLLAGSGVIFFVNYHLWGFNQFFIINSGIAFFGIWVAKILSARRMKVFQTFNEKLAQERQLMDTFIVYDPETGLMRRKFADQALAVEVARSQRLSTPLSMMMIDVPPQKQFPNGKIYYLGNLFGELFLSNLRKDVDIPFIGEEFGAILPEKDQEAAQLVGREMVEDMANVLDIQIFVGVASLGAEVNTAEGLIEAAKSALACGMTLDQAVVADQELLDGTQMSNTAFVEQETSLDFSENSIVDPEKLINSCELTYCCPNDWIVWLGGNQDASVVNWMDNKFSGSDLVKFLGWQDGFMVIQITLGSEAAAEFGKAFPNFMISAVDPKRHFVMLTPDQVKESIGQFSFDR